MATFSKQSELPSLPVPPLDDTLDRYLRSVRALVDDSQFAKTTAAVEEFRKSQVAQQLHESLLNRAKQNRNWLEDWWYDAYTEVREPIAPYLSVVAANTFYPALEGSQVCRAADIAYYWMQFRQRIRKEALPITRSRGVVWDMYQYHCLFNSSRVPELPKDKMQRYFKTVSEGPSPSYIVVFCRGNAWKVEMQDDEDIRSPDEIHKAFSHILRNSIEQDASVLTLTTEHRDIWAKARTSLISSSATNKNSIATIEEAAFCMTLSDEKGAERNKILETAMTGHHSSFWMDKSINLLVYADGQMTLQGDHSNLDAIVLLHAGDDAAARVRKDIWKPKNTSFEVPELIRFELTDQHRGIIRVAEQTFDKNKGAHRVNAVRYLGYGNEQLKQNKLYSDTVVQIAIQIAYLKTHGSFAPIYETASTRKFYHGRTETVRGCTVEMVAYGKAVLEGQREEVLRKLFTAAYDAHNNIMNECMEGNGFDRHLLGLRNSLSLFNKGCSPKQALPKMFRDEAWKASGGDGNFLLSTSFTGYMTDQEDGGHGYVCAMRPDGYGVFYKIGRDRFLLVTTDWKGTKSNLPAFGDNLKWAFDEIGTLFKAQSKQ